MQIDEQTLWNALSKKSDEDLVSIARGEGAYSPLAATVAEGILTARGITFSSADREQRRANLSARAEYESEREEIERVTHARQNRTTGAWVAVFGVFSFLLPIIGYQFSVLVWLGRFTPYVGGLLIVIGITLVLNGSRTVAEAEREAQRSGKTLVDSSAVDVDA